MGTDASGKVVLLVGIAQDITERKRAEEQLRKLDKLQSVGVPAGGIAHDFNNLLTGIIGNLSLLESAMNRNERSYKSLMEVNSVVRQAKNLAQQFLTFSKGGQPVKETKTIGSFLKESVLLALSGSNVRFDCFIPGDLWLTDADKGQLHQVVNNLSINAVQAMPAGGTFKVVASNHMVARR